MFTNWSSIGKVYLYRNTQPSNEIEPFVATALFRNRTDYSRCKYMFYMPNNKHIPSSY